MNRYLTVICVAFDVFTETPLTIDTQKSSFEFHEFSLLLLISYFEPQNRKQSFDDHNLDQFLKIANYEDTVKELDIYYGIGMF